VSVSGLLSASCLQSDNAAAAGTADVHDSGDSTGDPCNTSECQDNSTNHAITGDSDRSVISNVFLIFECRYCRM